jgi:hypothetical protein
MLKKILVTTVFVVTLIVAAFLLYARILPANEGKNPDEARVINVALGNVDLTEPDWQTIVLCATAEVNLPRKTVWETWSRIEDWKNWSPALVNSSRFIGGNNWSNGTAFEQVLELGFPLGTVRFHDTVGTFVDTEAVGWQQRGNYLVYSSVWLFEDVPGGKTLIVHAEIVHGSFIWLMKPLVAGRWQEKIETQVAGLVRYSSTEEK